MSADRQFKADPQFASKSQERRYRAQVRASPPLMPSAERRRILFAPIRVGYFGSQFYGGSRATWGGVAVNDDPSLLAKRHRPEWTEREFGE